MKRNRDILRPILKLAKSLPQYREKSRLQGEKLIINGTHYGMKDIGGLPSDLAAYKAAQLSDTSSIVFHGELSPFSNFHNTTFVIDGEKFPTSEHYIQYQKAMLFGDTYTANAILKAKTPFEAKKLSYQIKGTNKDEWRERGYDICFQGISEKFNQNPNLMNMLKATKGFVLAEASNDRLWGTGIPLRDKHTLSQTSWSSRGWLSDMLHEIRDK